MNTCFDQIRQIADRELNRVYEQVLNKGKDESIRQVLKEAESTWSSYRDKQCELESYGVRGGSVYPTIMAICITEKARARIMSSVAFWIVRRGT
jgi:uncharacterized protein YecT (DUF1311 family)